MAKPVTDPALLEKLEVGAPVTDKSLLAQLEDDQYKATARKEIAAEKAAGLAHASPYQRRLLQGMTFNAADEIMAGMATPIEMVKRGTWNPAEGYKYAKAREDIMLDNAREETGALGTGLEIGGGVLTGGTLARGGLSLTGRLAPNAGGLARTRAAAADSALYGGTAGALEGNTLEERRDNAIAGSSIGGVVGGASVPVVAGLRAIAAPVVSNIRARVNPEGYAQTQMARALVESSRTPGQVANDVAIAAREGQGMYTVADALGNPGQRMLSTVTRAPGPGRTEAVEFLEQRQAGQGRRMANILAEGFDAPQTSAQLNRRMTAQRSADADVNYGAARAQSGSVDVSPAIAEIDRTLQPGVSRIFNPGSNLADDSIEGALRRARSFLTDGRAQVSRFEEAFRIKTELDNMIDNAAPTLQRVLIPVRNALDDQLAASSAPYANARNQFSRQSQAIDAIEDGRTASMRGRTEDTVPAFRAMRPDQQQAYRHGYVDPLIEQTQGAAAGVNKARPFTSDAFREEAAAIAPLRSGEPMQRRIGRENTMFETRNHATQNSRTADNLADMDAQKIDPTILGNILSGNIIGAGRSALGAASNAMSGYTPEVRAELSRLLLTRGGNAPNFQRLIDEAVQRVERNRLIAAQLARGAYGGVATSPSASGNR